MPIAAATQAVLPSSHPIRDGSSPSTIDDVRYALHRAAKYLRAGGDRESVEPFIDEWLDYQAELELREEIRAL